MGLDLKEMQVCIRRILELFITSSRSFVKKYPVVSGILLLIFLLYMVLPSVVGFLIFSLPVLGFIAVAFRFIFRIHQQNLEKAKGEKRNYGISAQKPNFDEDDVMVDKRENSSVQPQSVRRRNVKEKDGGVYVQEGVEEKDMVFSTISNDALVDKAALIEEKPKEIREVNVDSGTDRAESSSAASQRSRHEFGDGSEGRTGKFNGGGSELEAESSEDAEDEDEEEAQEDGNKAVEWTEDDQKNLMDLGLSEMERNKRLESLIARRRARKLLSMQVRRTLMNTGSADPCRHIASILIPRSNPFPPPNGSGSAQVSPTPGSAPSVLLPMHNPFDLPYDPQEEKPNLTGGSFDEEFMAAYQKDLMFCRHESFSLGAFFAGPGEFDQSRRGTFYCPNFASRQRASEISEYSRFRNQSGKEDPSKLIHTESSQECKPMLQINSSYDHGRQQGQASEQVSNLVDIHHEEDRSEVHTESNIVRDVTGESSSSSSSELNVPFSAANKEQILKSLSFSVPKNIGVDREYNGRRNELLCDGSPSSLGKKRPDECFFFSDKGVYHTPTHSIASDMQVEVSEVSSPALTVDGTVSPSDGDSLTYDGDVEVEKETTSGSEEMWVASSQLSRVEENESRSREVHEVSEQDIMEVGFSRINQKSDGNVASDMLLEKVVEQDSIDSSASSAKIELSESSKVHDEVQPSSTSYSSDALSTENLASLTHENALQSSEKSAAHSSHHDNSGKPEERSDSPEKSGREVNIIYDVNDHVGFGNDDKEVLEVIKDTYGEAPMLIKQEESVEPSILTMENDIKALEIIEGNSGVPENGHSNSTEYSGRQSVPIPNPNGIKNIQDRNGEQGGVDVECSGANQSSNDSIESATQPEIVAEQGAPGSSSSSSSTSVTEDKVPIIQVSMSNFVQTTQLKVQEIDVDMVDDNFLDRPLPESSNLTVSNERDPEKLQGELQTFVESYKPAEESVNSKTSEEFEEQLEKLEENNDIDVTSKAMEKMDIWELIPSAMLQELVVEQVPVALSSSSSPKSEIQKMVSVEQASSSNIDPEACLMVQKSGEEIVEINMLDNLLPENLAPPALQNAEYLSSDSTVYPSYDKDIEEFQESSNSTTKSTQELNSIFSVMDSEVPPKDEMRNLETTDDINSEAHILAKEENAGVLSKISEGSTSKSTDVMYIEGQSGKMDEYQTILDSYVPIANNDEEKYITLAERGNTAETSNLNNTLETSQEFEQDILEVRISEVSPRAGGLIAPVMLLGTAESGLSGIDHSFNDPNPPTLMPETVAEQAPIASSTSSSPKSVLQNKFSIDQGSVLSFESFDQEIHMEAQLSEAEMEEHTTLNGLPPENLTAVVPQNALPLTEDTTAHLSSSYYSVNVQELCKDDDSGRSIEEGNINSNSNSNELLVNVMFGEEELRSRVGDTEGESQVSMTSQVVAEQLKNAEVAEVANSSSTENDEDKSKKLNETESMADLSQPAEKNDNLNNTKDTEETRNLVDQNSGSLDHFENSKGETKDLIKDDV